jgi:uncharacterized protein YcbK (DUF882 family)
MSKQRNRRRSQNHHNQNKPKPIRKRHKISEHFSRKDFYCPENNSSFRISAGLIGALEELRHLINARINIIKGFQSIESAEKSGKVKRNFHTIGVAADIQVETMSVEELFAAAEKVGSIIGIGIDFKKKIIHVDTRKNHERICWVEDDGNIIDLTDENRAFYFSK